MATFSVSAAGGVQGGTLAMSDDGAGAMIHAADNYSRRLGARSAGPADGRAPRESRGASEAERVRRDALPAGYVPLGEVKDLTLLGQWPLLEDRMSPCVPTKIIAAMQRKSTMGDHEAEAWLRMHAEACAGDPDAQRAFGRACENGSHRAPADLQRAFFWYYRAGLQGDDEARRNAERLMQRSSRICPAAMADPMLVYPGQWRITAHLSEHLRSASVFDLAADGSATGWLLGNSRATAGTPGPAGDPTCDELALPSPPPSACYLGGWAYDCIGQVLTIIFESEGGERRWRSATWQIELLGSKPGAIFGRDRRMVAYTLEHLSGSEL